MAKFTGKSAEFLINTAAAPPAVWTPVGQVQEIGDIAVTAEEVDVTTLDAGDYRDYIQGFKDPGECELTVIFDPNLPTQDDSTNGLLGLFNSGAVKQCAIRWNSSLTGGEQFGTFSAFIRDMNYGALNPDDPQTINPVFRLTTPITLVDALPTTLTAPTGQNLEALRRQEAELHARRQTLAEEEERLRKQLPTPRAESEEPVAA